MNPLQKSDGASLHAIEDLAAALDRYKKFQFDQMNDIVDMNKSFIFNKFSKFSGN